MADALNQAQTPTLQGTMPTLEQALQQAAQGLPPDALQQALGMGKAYDPLLAEQAARRTSELKPAEQAATAAEQAYQRQAAAPAPEVSGARAGLNELLGSVASILSGNQTYRESAATRLQKEQQALRDSRIENLTNLKEIYTKRAEAAKSLGNSIAEEENRIKKDRLEKQINTLNEARKHQYEMDEIARRGAEERRTQAAKPTEAMQPIPGVEKEVQAYRTVGGEDVRFINAGDFSPTDRSRLREQFKDQPVLILNKQDSATMSKLSDVGRTLDELVRIVPKLSDPYQGVGGWLRKTGKQVETGLAATGVGKADVVETVNSMNALRSTAIQMVQAFATLGSGLRINQAEINSVLTTDYPTPSDSRPQAMARIRRLREILSNIEKSALLGRGGAEAPEAPIVADDAHVGMTDTKTMRIVVKLKGVTKEMKQQGFKVGDVVWKDITDADLNSGMYDVKMRK